MTGERPRHVVVLDGDAAAFAKAGLRVTEVGVGERVDEERGGVRVIRAPQPVRPPRAPRTWAFAVLRRLAGAPAPERLRAARERHEATDRPRLAVWRGAVLRARSLNRLERDLPADPLERALEPVVVALAPDAVHARDAALAGRLAARAGASVVGDPGEPVPARAVQAAAGPARLGIGPRNLQGQARAWARAAARHLDGVSAESFAFRPPGAPAYPADIEITYEQWLAPDWQARWARRAAASYTHLLAELALSPLGHVRGEHFDAALPFLRRHGIALALVARGSEVRDPRAHASLEPDSPFADPGDRLTRRLQIQADALLPRLNAYAGPTFVSTADLLTYVPGAAWLPLVVDLDRWAAPGPPLARDVPVVVHAVSRGALKHSAAVDAACAPLAERGLIAYRRLEGVAPAEMPARLASADVVLDQFALGDYGGLACQAMAAGRVVVGHVRDDVRARLPAPLPIVEARAAEIGAVLERLIEDRASAIATAAEGRRYVETFHDGAYSARQLAPFLGVAR